MTKEEAEQLRPGDIISCCHDSNRELIECCVKGNSLHWHQKGSGSGHEYPYRDITLVKRGERVINNYQIY
jgi:hypothetical protein